MSHDSKSCIKCGITIVQREGVYEGVFIDLCKKHNDEYNDMMEVNRLAGAPPSRPERAVDQAFEKRTW